MGQSRNPQDMRYSSFYLSSPRIYMIVLIFIGFWLGALFSHQLLDRVGLTDDSQCPCDGKHDNDKEIKKPDFETKPSNGDDDDAPNADTQGVKKMIYLYDSPSWSDNDLWKAKDWSKCHRNDCIMTKNQQDLKKSSIVVVNSLTMPGDTSLRHLKDKMDRSNFDGVRFAFFSGVTPLVTKFDATKYDDLFDLLITYKSNSDVRLSSWPSNGILPSQLRLRGSHGRQTSDDFANKMDALPGKFDKHFFGRNGKEAFMAYVVRTCDDTFYGNRFVMKLREEGLIHIYTTKTNCTNILPEPQLLPCKDLYDDQCAKIMEKYKFVVITEANTCQDFIPKDYWYGLTAWEAVPVMFSSGNCNKMGIPGSCIDALESEYVSPTFKKAYNAHLDVNLYKDFWKWKESNQLEEYHWQCELCDRIHEKRDDTTEAGEMKFSQFWDVEGNCGASVQRNELMRQQLVRVGAISG